MLRITFDVNGREIGQIAIHNSGRSKGVGMDDPMLYHVYDVADVPDDESITTGEKLCSVWHDPNDSAMELVRTVTDELDDAVLD